MSEEQLNAFWDAVEADTTLQKKLQGITDPDDIAAIATEAGFTISAEEIKNALKSSRGELSGDELKDVSGGVGRRDALTRDSKGVGQRDRIAGVGQRDRAEGVGQRDRKSGNPPELDKDNKI